MLKLVILVCLAAASQAFIIGEGACPSVTTQENYKINYMKGKWYEVSRYFVIFQGLSRCTTWDWKNEKDDTVKLKFEGVSLLGEELKQEYRFLPDPDNDALLEFDEGIFRRATFQVIGTDYESYAVIYACQQIPFTSSNAQSLWVLSRRRSGLSSMPEARVAQILSDNGLDPTPLIRVAQSGCD